MKWLIYLICFPVLALPAQNRFDVVITEIFSDPTPAVGLPNFEWIEIRNRSSAPVNLQGWRLSDANSQSGPFPNFTLFPDSILIISGSSALPVLSIFGNAISITSFPSLDNEGDLLSLRSANGLNIHAVSYQSEWHGNELKQQGGWSLEMIDVGKPCLSDVNWTSSVNPLGGTPGRENSVASQVNDFTPPELLWSYAKDNSTLRLVFNEPLDSFVGASLSHYEITGNASLQAASVIPPLFTDVELKLADPIDTNVLYTVKAREIIDCEGNLLSIKETRTGLASHPQAGDWIVNEILFDPPPNAYDYVEFVNTSARILDLSELFIANRNSAGAIASITALSPTSRPVFPGDYFVVTEDIDRLQLNYHVKDPSRVLKLASLPSFPDNEGKVIALDSRGLVTDEVHYKKEWHFKLINEPRGVALEKLDPLKNSQDPMNWHSASSTAGFGTPGYLNSQTLGLSTTQNTLSLNSESFSPDNDGRNDILKIQYEFASSGNLVSLRLFDISGRMVRILVNNQLAGSKGFWTWDGLDGKGMKLPLGLYVILAETLSLDGKYQKIKLPVAIVKQY